MEVSHVLALSCPGRPARPRHSRGQTARVASSRRAGGGACKGDSAAGACKHTCVHGEGLSSVRRQRRPRHPRVPWQVTRHNFAETLPLVADALSRCDFFALDCEMTGLHAAERAPGAYLRDMQERYQEVGACCALPCLLGRAAGCSCCLVSRGGLRRLCLRACSTRERRC
jgi:hypothetical protein